MRFSFLDNATNKVKGTLKYLENQNKRQIEEDKKRKAEKKVKLDTRKQNLESDLGHRFNFLDALKESNKQGIEGAKIAGQTVADFGTSTLRNAVELSPPGLLSKSLKKEGWTDKDVVGEAIAPIDTAEKKWSRGNIEDIQTARDSRPVARQNEQAYKEDMPFGLGESGTARGSKTVSDVGLNMAAMVAGGAAMKGMGLVPKGTGLASKFSTNVVSDMLTGQAIYGGMGEREQGISRAQVAAGDVVFGGLQTGVGQAIDVVRAGKLLNMMDNAEVTGNLSKWAPEKVIDEAKAMIKYNNPDVGDAIDTMKPGAKLRSLLSQAIDNSKKVYAQNAPTPDIPGKSSYPAFDDNIKESFWHKRVGDGTKLSDTKIVSTDEIFKNGMSQGDVDPGKVTPYIKKIKSGEPIEPIVVEVSNIDEVAWNGAKPEFKIRDGHHRIVAAAEAGYKDIPVKIVYDTDELYKSGPHGETGNMDKIMGKIGNSPSVGKVDNLGKPITLYHGTSPEGYSSITKTGEIRLGSNPMKEEEGMVWLTRNPETAKFYSTKGDVVKSSVPSNMNLIDREAKLTSDQAKVLSKYNGLRQEYDPIKPGMTLSQSMSKINQTDNPAKLKDIIKKLGYDGVLDGDNVLVPGPFKLSPSASSKVGKVEVGAKIETPPIAAKVAPEKVSNQKVVGTFSRLEREAVANNVVDTLGADKPMYNVDNMAEQVAKAEQLYSVDPERAVRIAMGDEVAGDGLLNNAVYETLKEKALKENNVDLVEKLANSKIGLRSTEMGKEISALRGRDIENPVDAIQKISSERAKAVEAKLGGNLDKKIQKTVAEIKEATGGIKDSGKVVDDLVSGLKTTADEPEKRLAKRVMSQVLPPKKRTVDVLVNELTRVAKESLPTKSRTKPKAAIDLIREMFDRSDKALATYDAAKDIVMKKFADRPDILDALAKYEETRITRPVAEITVTRAVRDELKAKGLNLKSIIQTSIDQQKTTADDITQALTENGFSPEASESFGNLASKEISSQIANAKESALKSMVNQMGKTREALNFEKKIAKLSNLGALTEKDYLDLARAKLGIDVSHEEAVAISDMAQNIQKFKARMNPDHTFNSMKEQLDYGFAKEDLKEFISNAKYEAEKVPLGEALKHPLRNRVATKVMGFMKSMRATFDNSVVGRQGRKILSANPKEWAKLSIKSFQDMYKSFGGDNVMRGVNADAMSRPNALNGKYKKLGLDIGGLEEAYPTQAPEKIPYFGRVFKASEAAYSGFLQRARVDFADMYIDAAEKAGKDLDDKEFSKSLGSLIASLTSRGKLGKLEPIADTLNVWFFSPRNLKANIDTLLVHPFEKMDPWVRKEALKNTTKYLLTTAAMMAMTAQIGRAMGYDDVIEWDPRSSNFMKIKIGNTRFDMSGGVAPVAVLLSRILPTLIGQGYTKSSTTGELKKINSGDFGAQDGMDIFYNFMEGKASPGLGLLINQMKGETYEGDKLTPLNALKEGLVPMPITSYEEMAKDPNSANIWAGMIAEMLGVGTSTYAPKPKSKKIQKRKSYMLNSIGD